MTDPKSAARKAAFARRKAALTAGQGQAATHLAAHLATLGHLPLAGYIAMRTEIDPAPAMAGHAGAVCVPVIIGASQALRFRAWSPGCSMIPGPFGAAIPADGAWITPRVLIVPLLAFDARGFRLGYGGGFYDRTLEALRAQGPVTAIGFAFAAQEVPEVPTEPTDQRLDAIVTETGLRRFAP